MDTLDKSKWNIKPIGWNKWGVFIDDALVAQAEDRYLCTRFIQLPLETRLTRIGSDPVGSMRPLPLENLVS